MYDECLVAEYQSMEDARTALDVLETFGFTTDSVSLVSQQNASELEQIGEMERDSAATTKSGKSTGLGALIGGSAAAPLALVTMVGPVMVAGPLAGMATGAVVGGLLSKASDWGVNEDVGKELEQRVSDGAVLIFVNAKPVRIDEAERGLATTNPTRLKRFAHAEKTPD